MDDVPHVERYAARDATIRTDGVEGVEIDGEKSSRAHAHLLQALQLDDAANHIEADARSAVRYETMKAVKANKLMAKRAERERARREKKKQVWAARDKLLSQSEQVTARTTNENANENAGDGNDDDDDNEYDDDDDCSETTNDCARHKNNAAHQRHAYMNVHIQVRGALAMSVACVAVCVAVTNYVMMLMILGTHMTPMTSPSDVCVGPNAAPPPSPPPP